MLTDFLERQCGLPTIFEGVRDYIHAGVVIARIIQVSGAVLALVMVLFFINR